MLTTPLKRNQYSHTWRITWRLAVLIKAKEMEVVLWREITSGITSEKRIGLEEEGVGRLEILLISPKLSGLQIFKGLHSHYRRFICMCTHISQSLDRVSEKRKPFQDSTAWFNIFQYWKRSLSTFQLSYVPESLWCWTPLLNFVWHKTQMMLLACYRRDPNSPCRNALSEIPVIKQIQLLHWYL